MYTKLPAEYLYTVGMKSSFLSLSYFFPFVHWSLVSRYWRNSLRRNEHESALAAGCFQISLPPYSYPHVRTRMPRL